MSNFGLGIELLVLALVSAGPSVETIDTATTMESGAAAAQPAPATQSTGPAVSIQNYSYDVLGRLIQVDSASGNAANTQTTYVYDPAGNRTSLSVSTTGSRPPTRVVVVPLAGFTIIPIPMSQP